ncbi:ribonuclease E/G [Roseococcus sp. DSY-14]|uniref:ribonuclease E/G n=1 Tax=Roseococcus sp. DSY-14 TaxID=3369650 RepID=UPI00387B46FE
MAAPVEIRVARSPGERRVALLRGGVLAGYRVERPARPDGVGDVLRGRVEARTPALGGGFVALPGGATGFLPESECAGRRLPPEGSWLTLRVIRAAQNGKGLRVSARLPQQPGSGLALLERGPDQARRWMAAFPAAAITCDDAAEAARLGARHAPAFDDALEAEAEALAEPEVPLAGGGRLILSPLPALTAVDVDSGAADPRDANRRAIAEFARQLVLRDLSGPILLDLAGLSVKQRAALEPELRAALAPDGLAQPLGFGPLGLFELRRARIYPPLHEVLADRPLARGLALLRRASRERAAEPHRRLALQAPAAVLAAIRGLPGALEEFGGPLALRESAQEEVADA